MTSKEAIQVLKNHNNRKYELVNKRRYAVSIIEQDLEILEEIRKTFKVVNYGKQEDPFYMLIVNNRFNYLITKESYNKWLRWLEK